MAQTKGLPSVSDLRSMLAYRKDGVLIWKRPPDRCRVKPGHIAGSKRKRGDLQVKIKQTAYLAHRIIWAMLKKEDPGAMQIDHINGNPGDNRIENLRKATVAQNNSNRKDVLGCVYIGKINKWRARIKFNNKTVHLGEFASKGDARAAYLLAKERLHGDFMDLNAKRELDELKQLHSQTKLFHD